MFSLLRRSATMNQTNFVTKAMQAKCFSTSSPDFSKYDPSQTKFLDESLILVDREDKVIGKISKVDGHLNSYNKTGSAHRAFSVFLFNQQNQLLLHQRSEKKITFPSLWTNSCCSHPLYNDDEIVEDNYIGIEL
jgi:isopentenyl-diphosphate delta-isomerase